MKKIKYLALVLLTLSVGCGQNKENKEEKLEDDLYGEVMSIHDEVMPRLSTIISLEQDLKEAVEKLDSTSADQDQLDRFTVQITALQEADEAMMQWMRNFEVNQEGWTHDSVMSYLEKEKDKISQVRDRMMESIENAQVLVDSLGK